MNFSPFGGHFPGTIPGIHQFAASGALVSTSAPDNVNRYHSSNVNIPHFNQPHAPILGKFRPDDVNNMNKYNGHTNQYSTPYSQDGQSVTDKQQRGGTSSSVSYPQTTLSGSVGQQPPEIPQQQTDAKRVLQNVNPSWQSLTPSSAVADYLSHLPASTLPLSLHHFLKYSAESIKKESQNPLSSQNLNNLGAGLLPPNNTNLNHQSQHQQQAHQQQTQQSHQQTGNTNTNDHAQQQTNAPATTGTKKKKKKKAPKPPKEKKPRPKPGEIRLTTALDGSTLFCCPECQMAYPERGLLEQHLVGHNLERRFICDICNAALKRKDHLTRHKQSHNPERPFVCTICLKAFKRKEQLTLHFVIHSGEKRHICNECGKGFYRKDHLRKHTRSHIARRVKAELSQQNQPAGGGGGGGGAQGGVVPNMQQQPYPLAGNQAPSGQQTPQAGHHNGQPQGSGGHQQSPCLS
ncbi:zinc finger protein with KRAB and SCAN domains 1-like [Lutzomyia longipalpis]|uniref:zinc finger protein with KRAB and SCAN domains 1-like n=1 Tax=Lutzomyia longipalpis TaxID=7200 RepID=UPI0024841594|nr:zinc finger protein with KRAB and SCAN domains 1-like [Lutzomyia longipalpis]XP_055691707.1 zinc finger protein with KRAB and SCAN domains 1-like [Lutzomyia longipalpis]XP_055691708.1 zinc finger protein with KRAB and SCAN domains 1-like [Lutzomyia longipalpis]XP_055691709.1 zinc finger protein with KRAB and SCAN domains 1-like [Lutzomyia longipalpis]